MTWQNMLFSAQGRIRRTDYWLWSIGKFIFFMVLYAAIGLLTRASIGVESETPNPIMLLTYVICVPLSLWTSVCIGAKRWHDRDKSGLMYLILLIPLVGVIWTFIECGCLDGTPGRNQYGPSPKGIGNESAVF